MTSAFFGMSAMVSAEEQSESCRRSDATPRMISAVALIEKKAPPLVLITRRRDLLNPLHRLGFKANGIIIAFHFEILIRTVFAG